MNDLLPRLRAELGLSQVPSENGAEQNGSAEQVCQQSVVPSESEGGGEQGARKGEGSAARLGGFRWAATKFRSSTRNVEAASRDLEMGARGRQGVEDGDADDAPPEKSKIEFFLEDVSGCNESMSRMRGELRALEKVHERAQGAVTSRAVQELRGELAAGVASTSAKAVRLA